MATFLPVVPNNIMRELHRWPHIKEYETATSCAFLLAHDIVRFPTEWMSIRDGWSRQSALSILDNSVIELGGAVDFEMVKEAANITHPQVVVLPDVLEDADDSIKATLDAWPEWYEHFGNVTSPMAAKPQSELMIVPQGETLIAWLRCLETIMFETEGMPAWIGIPRNTTGRIIESRDKLVTLVNALYPGKRIHLLGFSDFMWDDIISAKNSYVTSIDSAVPFRMPTFQIYKDPLPRGDWWDTAKYEPWMKDNFEQVSEIMNTVFF